MFAKADLTGLRRIAKDDSSFIDRLLDAFDDELISFEKALDTVRKQKDTSLLRPAFHKIRPTLDLLSLGPLIRQIELLVISPAGSLEEHAEQVAAGIRHLRDDIADERGL